MMGRPSAASSGSNDPLLVKPTDGKISSVVSFWLKGVVNVRSLIPFIFSSIVKFNSVDGGK